MKETETCPMFFFDRHGSLAEVLYSEWKEESPGKWAMQEEVSLPARDEGWMVGQAVVELPIGCYELRINGLIIYPGTTIDLIPDRGVGLAPCRRPAAASVTQSMGTTTQYQI